MKPKIIIQGLAIVLILSVTVSAQTITPEKEKQLAREVSEFFDRYNEWFGSGRTHLIAERALSSPSIRLVSSGMIAMVTAEDIKKNFEAIRKPLLDDGYVRSEWVERNIRVMNDSAVVVSGSFVRYRKDGTKLGHFASTYFLGKNTDGWRIVAMAGHDVSRVIPAK